MKTDLSYSELVSIENDFEVRCKEMGVKWLDNEVRQEALMDFCQQYIDGVDEPEVLLCDYGYELC